MAHSPPFCKKVALSIMRSMFSDIEKYEDMEPRLAGAIGFLQVNPINFSLVNTLTEKYYSKDEIKSMGSNKWKVIRWIFSTCCVLVVSLEDRAKEVIWETTAVLTEAYPMLANKFKSLDLNLLLSFRNAVRVAMLIMDPKRKKDQFLFMAGRLEGTKERYITGSGQSLAVTMRVEIFRQETGVVAEDRSYRDKTPPVCATPRQIKRPRENLTASATSSAANLTVSNPRQKRKAKESSVAVGSDFVTPAPSVKGGGGSFTATKAPTATPCAAKQHLDMFDVVADAAAVAFPACGVQRSITPDPSMSQQAPLIVLSVPPTPTKALRSSSAQAHFMHSSTDWPKYCPLDLGASQDSGGDGDGGWAEVAAVQQKSIAPDSPAVEELQDADFDVCFDDLPLEDILGGEWDDYRQSQSQSRY